MITFVSPFPPERIPLLWMWLHEYPLNNFDDSRPRSVDELAAQCWWRQQDGEILWEVRVDDCPVGAIGYRKLSAGEGAFRGIVFTSSQHGSGVPYHAVAQALKLAFRDGAYVVRAEYFASNRRIQRLLEKLGGTVCDYITCGSFQNGIPIDWKVVEVREIDFVQCYKGPEVDPQRCLPPGKDKVI